MDKEIRIWLRSCLPCQAAKIHRYNKHLPGRLPTPDHCFEHVHINFIGPLPICQNYRYCLTMVDRFSRWLEAVPLSNISTDTVVSAFYSNWIARFGTPRTVTSDQGSQFEAALFRALTNLVGCGEDEDSSLPSCFQQPCGALAPYA